MHDFVIISEAYSLFTILLNIFINLRVFSFLGIIYFIACHLGFGLVYIEKFDIKTV